MHAWQASKPVTFLNLPAAHSKQGSPLRPTSHAQVSLPLCETLPTEQGRHSDAETPAELFKNFPASHESHVCSPLTSLYLPGSQDATQCQFTHSRGHSRSLYVSVLCVCVHVPNFRALALPLAGAPSLICICVCVHVLCTSVHMFYVTHTHARTHIHTCIYKHTASQPARKRTVSE